MIKSNKSNLWRGRIFRYAPLILWIGVVLFASTTTGSMNNTSRIIRPILEFIFPNTTEETLLTYHHYIRKMAHLTEYGIMALWASRAFWHSSVKFLRKYWFLAAFVLAASVALVDEFNQSFNTARTGSVYDVLIDISGAVIIIITLFAYKYLRQIRK